MLTAKKSEVYEKSGSAGLPKLLGVYQVCWSLMVIAHNVIVPSPSCVKLKVIL